MTQACEKLDTKQKNLTNLSKHLSNIDEEEEKSVLKTEVVNTENDTKGDNDIVGALFPEGGDFKMGEMTISQLENVPVKKSVLCQDIENLTPACEKLDAKQQKLTNLSENLSNIDEEEEAFALKTEVLKQEECVSDDSKDGDRIVGALFSEGGDIIEQPTDAHVEKSITVHMDNAMAKIENDTDAIKSNDNCISEGENNEGLFEEAKLPKDSDRERGANETDLGVKKEKKNKKSKKMIQESARERQRKRRLKVKMSGEKIGSSEGESRHEVCCQWCGILFKARSKLRLSVNLSQHQKRRHPLELTERLGLLVERLPCPKCRRSFTERSDYHRHLRHSHGPKNHVCQECGFATHLDRLLRVHRSKKHNSKEVELKPLPCSFCGKKISQMGNLQRHEDVMHRGIRLKCEQCDLGFKDKRGLVKHKNKMHRNV